MYNNDNSQADSLPYEIIPNHITRRGKLRSQGLSNPREQKPWRLHI